MSPQCGMHLQQYGHDGLVQVLPGGQTRQVGFVLLAALLDLAPAPAPAPLPPAELVAQELPVDLALVGGAPRDLDGARAAETGEIIHCLVSVPGISQAGVDNIILSLYIYF